MRETNVRNLQFTFSTYIFNGYHTPGAGNTAVNYTGGVSSSSFLYKIYMQKYRSAWYKRLLWEVNTKLLTVSILGEEEQSDDDLPVSFGCFPIVLSFSSSNSCVCSKLKMNLGTVIRTNYVWPNPIS